MAIIKEGTTSPSHKGCVSRTSSSSSCGVYPIPPCDTSSTSSMRQPVSSSCSSPCDACPFCDDICDNEACVTCRRKAESIIKKRKKDQQVSCPPDALFFASRGGGGGSNTKNKKQNYYTPCQIRRHCDMRSVWIVAGDTVYDATRFLEDHPGGRASILNKAGGTSDCSIDYQFHGPTGKKMWKHHEIGKVRDCCGNEILGKVRDCCDRGSRSECWWMFWRG